MIISLLISYVFAQGYTDAQMDKIHRCASRIVQHPNQQRTARVLDQITNNLDVAEMNSIREKIKEMINTSESYQDIHDVENPREEQITYFYVEALKKLEGVEILSDIPPPKDPEEESDKPRGIWSIFSGPSTPRADFYLTENEEARNFRYRSLSLVFAYEGRVYSLSPGAFRTTIRLQSTDANRYKELEPTCFPGPKDQEERDRNCDQFFALRDVEYPIDSGRIFGSKKMEAKLDDIYMTRFSDYHPRYRPNSSLLIENDVVLAQQGVYFECAEHLRIRQCNFNPNKVGDCKDQTERIRAITNMQQSQPSRPRPSSDGNR